MRAPVLRTLLGLAAAAALFATPASADGTFTLPAGTTLRVRLTTNLSSRTTETGDRFTAEVTEPIFNKGEEVVPGGSMVEGRVSFVRPPGRAKGVAEMRLTPEKISVPSGAQYLISAALQGAEGAPDVKVVDEEGTLKGKGKSKKTTAEEAGIGAGAGAGIGGLADGGTGALYGAAIGAGAALAHRLLKRHQDIVVPQGTELSFVLNRAATAKKIAPPEESSK